MLPKIIEYLKSKEILILGFGREGRATYDYIRKYLPTKKLTIADKNSLTIDDNYLNLICGDNYLDDLKSFDLIMKSPGISFRDVEIPKGVEITCEVDLFLRFAPIKTIGVTGSKGKTTTSTLIYEILKAGGFDARLIGNIGIPVFETLETLKENTIAVIEMSSHQLEFTKASPNVAVLTNIYEEHLDHYKGGFLGYVNAKLNIVRFQKDENTFIYNATQGISDYIDLSQIKSKKIGVKESDDLPFKVNNEHLLGEHNRQDIAFAIAAASVFGVNLEDAEKGIKNFNGIENRMEKVGTFKDITFYNDCIATIPHAVMCAVNALKDVDTLIIGGKDRGLDYSSFVDDLISSSVKNIIGTPETGHKIGNAIKAKDKSKNVVLASDLEMAVKAAYEFTEKNKICLLSPAASSYNAYKNFEEKGRHYKELIEKYSK
ncbi:MAG: UDP-N-acetylmuramoyl-L-alanine--D-glutamate ligase [Oscillospiraceae bacterium]